MRQIVLQMQWNKLSLLLLIMAALLNSACSLSSSGIEIKRAESAESENDFKLAAKHYLRAIRRDPESSKALYAAKKLANISLIELKDFEQTAFAYRFIVLNSKEQSEMILAQEQLAKLYFEKKSDFEQAILEFQRLLSWKIDTKKQIQYRFFLARSYFSLSKFYQAEVEIEDLKKLKPNKDDEFQAELLLANIQYNQKNLEQAAATYKSLMEKWPEQSIKNKVSLSLAICFEELNQYDQAITLLESDSLKQKFEDRGIYELRISKLKEMKMLQPGARGLKK